VGHTHNGVDRCHFTHNQGLGKYYCPTLAEWVAVYPRAWHANDGGPPPYAVYCDYQYNWEKHYASVMESLEGFLKSRTGETQEKVGAFRVRRGAGGNVEVTFKRHAILNQPWHGINGPDSPGFIVLRSRPLLAPRILGPVPERNQLHQQHEQRGVASKIIRQLCEMHGTPDAVDFNLSIVRTGTLPLGAAVDATESYDGRVHMFGRAGAQTQIRYVFN